MSVVAVVSLFRAFSSTPAVSKSIIVTRLKNAQRLPISVNNVAVVFVGAVILRVIIAIASNRHRPAPRFRGHVTYQGSVYQDQDQMSVCVRVSVTEL